MNNLDEYRGRAIQTHLILNQSPASKFVWREACSGVEITASPFEVLSAEYELNRIFALRGYISVEEFLRLLGYEKDTPVNGGLGWSIDMAASDGWQWIDVCHEFLIGEGKVLIDYITPPSFDFMEAWE